jgi:putative sigma-54 modulation protein
MDLQITGKHTQLTDAARRYIERKLDKLNRHLPRIIESKVEIVAEKTKSRQDHLLVRATVAGGGGIFHGEERGEDLFRAVDKLVNNLTRQIEDYKGKRFDKGRGESLARAEFSAEPEEIKAPRVVKVKRFNMKPMSVTEAAEQMELLSHSFFFFLNADTEELNLLYQRHDGNYGLIESELR